MKMGPTLRGCSTILAFLMLSATTVNSQGQPILCREGSKPGATCSAEQLIVVEQVYQVQGNQDCGSSTNGLDFCDDDEIAEINDEIKICYSSRTCDVDSRLPALVKECFTFRNNGQRAKVIFTCGITISPSSTISTQVLSGQTLQIQSLEMEDNQEVTCTFLRLSTLTSPIPIQIHIEEIDLLAMKGTENLTISTDRSEERLYSSPYSKDSSLTLQLTQSLTMHYNRCTTSESESGLFRIVFEVFDNFEVTCSHKYTNCEPVVPAPPPGSNEESTPDYEDKKLPTATIIAAVFGGLVLVILLLITVICILCFVLRKRRKNTQLAVQRRERQSMNNHPPAARYSSYGRTSNIYLEIADLDNPPSYYSEIGPVDSILDRNKLDLPDRPAPKIPHTTKLDMDTRPAPEIPRNPKLDLDTRPAPDIPRGAKLDFLDRPAPEIPHNIASGGAKSAGDPGYETVREGNTKPDTNVNEDDKRNFYAKLDNPETEDMMDEMSEETDSDSYSKLKNPRKDRNGNRIGPMDYAKLDSESTPTDYAKLDSQPMDYAKLDSESTPTDYARLDPQSTPRTAVSSELFMEDNTDLYISADNINQLDNGISRQVREPKERATHEQDEVTSQDTSHDVTSSNV